MGDIDRIIKNSSKAELIETLSRFLEDDYDKVVVVLIKDKANGAFTSETMLLGVANEYDACGILEVGKHDLLHGD